MTILNWVVFHKKHFSWELKCFYFLVFKMSSFVLRNFDAFQTKQTFQIFHKNINVCCVMIRLSRQFADVKAPFIQTFWQLDEDNCRVCRLLSLCVSFSVLQKCSFSIVPSASCCGVCYLGDGDLCVFTEIPRQKSRMNEWIPIMIRSSLVSPYNFYLQKTYIFFVIVPDEFHFCL